MNHGYVTCCRLLSSVTQLINSTAEVWIVPVLACILIQAFMVAATIPVATYTYAHARAAQFGPVAWVPTEPWWARHIVVGTSYETILIPQEYFVQIHKLIGHNSASIHRIHALHSPSRMHKLGQLLHLHICLSGMCNGTPQILHSGQMLQGVLH